MTKSFYSDMTIEELKEAKEYAMDYYAEMEVKGNEVLKKAAMAHLNSIMEEIKNKKKSFVPHFVKNQGTFK